MNKHGATLTCNQGAAALALQPPKSGLLHFHRQSMKSKVEFMLAITPYQEVHPFLVKILAV